MDVYVGYEVDIRFKNHISDDLVDNIIYELNNLYSVGHKDKNVLFYQLDGSESSDDWHHVTVYISKDSIFMLLNCSGLQERMAIKVMVSILEKINIPHNVEDAYGHSDIF